MFGHYEELNKFKQKKKELESKVRTIERDLRKGLSKSSSEQAAQLENYEVLLELLKVTESELNEINNKIYHLENSNY